MKKIKTYIIALLFLIFSILFLYSIYKIVMWKLNVDKNDNINKEIIQKNIKEDEKKIYNVDFDTLKKQNPDTIAYLKVKGTNINYIVVKTTDNDYYLRHNFNKEYNIAGWIFADYHNNFAGTDKNIIIYGHNMTDGSMFGTLLNVLQRDWQKNKENTQITLITERKKLTYETFSTYTIEAEDYYITTNFENNEAYFNFLNILKQRSNHNYNVDISPNDRILTLSSCLNDGRKRIVLHAKLIKAEERT